MTRDGANGAAEIGTTNRQGRVSPRFTLRGRARHAVIQLPIGREREAGDPAPAASSSPAQMRRVSDGRASDYQA